MATRRLREFLDGNHARYVLIEHSPAYTASQVAASAHVPGDSMAKVVVFVTAGKLALAVVPSTKDVDMTRLQELTGTNDVRLAEEGEFSKRFEGCKLGTVPPFGDLFGIDAYVDRSLSEKRDIAFNAGTHTDVVLMGFTDFCHLAKPKLGRISMAPVQPMVNVAQL